MIEPEILQRAESFIQSWLPIAKQYPRYRLDYSWPSIGIVDAILNPLREQEKWSDQAMDLIHNASAYLGIMAYTCWNLFPDQPQVKLLFDAKEGVVIRAQKSNRASELGKPFSVSISDSLRKVLQLKSTAMPFFMSGEAPLYDETPVVSLFAYGLFSGLCPYGQGPWNSVTEEEAAVRLTSTDLSLASTTARYYRDTFPGEPRGALLELYRSGIIYPPVGFEEDFLCVRATNSLMTRLLEQQIDLEEIKTTALNIACLPDAGLSHVGFAIASALQRNTSVDSRLLALSQSKGVYTGALHQAIKIARVLAGLPTSWADVLKDLKTVPSEQRPQIIAACKKLLAVDDAMGLTPYLRISLETMSEEPFTAFSLPLSLGQFSFVESMVDEIKMKRAVPPDITLQRAFLAAHKGDFERANSLAAEVKDTCSTDFLRVTLSEVDAMCRLGNGDTGGVITALTPLLSNIPTTSQFLSIAHLIIRAHIKERNAEGLLEITDTILAKHPGALEPRLARISALRSLGCDEECREQLSILLRYAPMDRRAWKLLLRQSRQVSNNPET